MGEIDHSKKTGSCDTSAARAYQQRHDRSESKPIHRDPASTNPSGEEAMKVKAKKSSKDPIPKLY